MRRKDREKGREFALDVIDRCAYGVVAFAGEDGKPYCVPLSLVRVGETLYFHCAHEGKKTELLLQNPNVYLSFVADNQTSEDEFTTYFESAAVAGSAFPVSEREEKISALRALCEKLTPDQMHRFQAAIARSLERTAVWGIRMVEVTGKAKSKQMRGAQK